MRPAAELQQIRADLWFWQAFDPAVKCDLSSCALRVESEFLLVDPIDLTSEALVELAEIAAPTAIIITNANHARAADWYREQFQVPVMAHADTRADLGTAIDCALAEDEPALASMTVITIPGAVAGEIAIHFAAGVMVIGDALIHLDPLGFTFLPDKYCADPQVMRAALQKLLRFDFEVLTFAHGLPLVARARPRLETLLR